jgi:hypothetical protein
VTPPNSAPAEGGRFDFFEVRAGYPDHGFVFAGALGGGDRRYRRHRQEVVIEGQLAFLGRSERGGDAVRERWGKPT